MSLLNWLSPRKKSSAELSVPAVESAGLTRMESTRPAGSHVKGAHGGHGNQGGTGAQGAPSSRKSERMAQRELLYGIVRECMVRAGVLSSTYKFKVLSLDAWGRQFLVMVDLAQDHLGEAARMSEIEVMIAQQAKARHDIVVTAVYWRLNGHVAVGSASSRPAHRATDSQPMPLESQPGELSPRASAASAAAAPSLGAPVRPPAPSTGRYEPVLADEVDAFKRALAGGASTPAALTAARADGGDSGAHARTFQGSGVHGPRSYTLLTGFEDTELPDEDMRRGGLSGTQYGELK